jgi:hypothetical protein
LCCINGGGCLNKSADFTKVPIFVEKVPEAYSIADGHFGGFEIPPKWRSAMPLYRCKIGTFEGEIGTLEIVKDGLVNL